VVLGQYGNAPEIGVDLYVELDKNNSTAIFNIPALVVETLRYLAIPRATAVWFHPDYETEIELLYAKDVEFESIPKILTAELTLSTDYEPIDCFYYALEIYTREKLPEHWAMLQHNLGLAYFDRIKGERWENLQRSIECFNKSLEVFTQDKFPEKCRINWEDLTQSRVEVQVEKLNLVKDIFDKQIPYRQLKGVDLSRIYMDGLTEGGYAPHNDPRHAYLMGADLRQADFTKTRLHCANLSHANLSHANLIFADLTRSDLSNADLSNTDLRKANLIGANLIGANLIGADVNNTQFGNNSGISESMMQDLIDQGAIFEDAPGDRSESRTLVPR
jgi:uncharacterized protein YjbI with pentapeptide repeats